MTSKYGAKKTTVNGVKFDSKAEARRWVDLLLLQKSGAITELQRQVMFVLAPPVRLRGEKRSKPELRYCADFCYREARNYEYVVEDVKGVVTPVFRIKQHLMATVHGISVRITK